MKQEQMKVLLSIKPKHAELIFNGIKKYEFRRAMFKNTEVKTVVVYASSPVKKVIGEFQIEAILKLDLKSLWNTTKQHAGINEEFFYKYFDDRQHGFAIKINKAKKYDNALCLKDDFNLLPPQSFLYLYKQTDKINSRGLIVQ